MANNIYIGDALSVLKNLPDQSVHCCVTSPPYWGLRDYGVDGQIGLEETPDEYVGKMVAVFGEVWRVLRNDGTLWLNLGDCYISNSRMDNQDIKYGPGKNGIDNPNQKRIPGLKSKDLVGIPWRIAFALQADGWYLRSDIIWHKPNPMPESVTDRPTRSHEYIFLLTKAGRYFYDQEAIKEAASFDSHARYARGRSNNHKWADGGPGNQTIAKTFEHMRKPGVNPKASVAIKDIVEERNIRSVWTIASHPYKGAHFATFPPKLIEPCIRAGTSPKGCCPECGVPLVRVAKPSVRYAGILGKSYHDHGDDLGMGMMNARGHNGQNKMRDAGINGKEMVTVGWQSTCSHNLDPIPCTVLDPFAGSGTTGLVARNLGRDFILIELNGKYVDMGIRRVTDLFTDVTATLFEKTNKEQICQPIL